MAKEFEFIGTVERQIYDSENYKMYAISIDREKYPDIKLTIYGSVTIGGNLHSLTPGAEYQIKATEKQSNRGYMYNVLNIKKTDLKSEGDVYTFLREILTFEQASELYREYPNIIDLVVSGKADNIVDLKKLHNIGDYRWRVIKEKIIENFALYDLVNEFKGCLTLNMVKAIYDTYPSIEKIRSEIRKDPYRCFTSIARVGFRTADSLLLDLEKEGAIKFSYDLRTSKQRCLACMIYLLEENESNGNTKIGIVELRKQVMKLTPACSEHFVDCINGNMDFWYSKESMEIALRSTYEVELSIAKEIKSRLNNKNIWNYDIEKYRIVDGISLSDEQMGFLDSVCKEQFVILSAPGGTGKSFSTKALINMFEDNNINYRLASPTGKAAKRLSEYTGRTANTIHKLLGYKNGKFEHDENNPIITDVLLLDEVGMTDIKLFRNLLKATLSNTKIVLIGDEFQLNSVGAGALLRDLISCDYIPQVHFTHVYRLGEGGALTACTYVRQNKQFLKENKLTQLGTDKSYSFIPSSKEKMNDMVLQLYKKLLDTWTAKDITVISSYNVGENGCDALNKILQPIANPLSLNKNTPHIDIKQDKYEVSFYEGDSVIQNVNNYHAKLYYENEILPHEAVETFIPNGTQGTIIKIENYNVIIDFDGETVVYNRGDLNSVKHSFALSCHKMQGSQNKVIIFCMPSSHIFMLNNNICYTALSRAEKMVYHFSDIKTIKSTMNKSDNKKRQTMLGDLLTD